MERMIEFPTMNLPETLYPKDLTHNQLIDMVAKTRPGIRLSTGEGVYWIDCAKKLIAYAYDLVCITEPESKQVALADILKLTDDDRDIVKRVRKAMLIAAQLTPPSEDAPAEEKTAFETTTKRIKHLVRYFHTEWLIKGELGQRNVRIYKGYIFSDCPVP